MPKGQHRKHKVLNSPERVEELCASCIPLVHHLVKKMSHIPLSYYDDAVSEAYLILVKCARTFDSSRGLAFSTFAGNSIKLHLSPSKWKIACRLEKMVFAFSDSVGNDYDIGYQEEEKADSEIVENLLKKIPSQQRNILVMLQDYSLREVGDKLGISPQRVHQLGRQAMQKLKELSESK